MLALMAMIMLYHGGLGDIDCNGYCDNGDGFGKVYSDSIGDRHGATMVATATAMSTTPTMTMFHGVDGDVVAYGSDDGMPWGIRRHQQ